MRLSVLAVARPDRGPEHELGEMYRARIDALSSVTRLGPAAVSLTPPRAGQGADREAEKLLAAAGDADKVVVLDERGDALDSAAFATLLGRWRDDGARRAAFLIGGADGHGQAALTRADRRLSLGPMTWPHLLARAMLLEQLYRAATVLAGRPYHRA